MRSDHHPDCRMWGECKACDAEMIQRGRDEMRATLAESLRQRQADMRKARDAYPKDHIMKWEIGVLITELGSLERNTISGDFPYPAVPVPGGESGKEGERE